MVNVPPVYPTWFLLLGCLSVKLGFPPVLTHTPKLYPDNEQKAILIAFFPCAAYLWNSLPGACFPASCDLSCFKRNLSSHI